MSITWSKGSAGLLRGSFQPLARARPYPKAVEPRAQAGSDGSGVGSCLSASDGTSGKADVYKLSKARAVNGRTVLASSVK